MEAFSMLAPAGWSFEGGIRWSVESVMMPATGSFRVSGNGVTMRALPGQAFFWTDLPQVRLSHPVGSKYLGATVCPPLMAADVIKSLVLPALRQGVDGLAILEESPAAGIESLPGLGPTLASCGTSLSDGARARIEYAENGRAYEEELFCTVASSRFTIPAGGSDISYMFWIADHLFSFRAPKGKLDDISGIFQAMVHSFRVNARWQDKYDRIVLFLKDRQMHRHYSLRQLSADVDREPVIFDDGRRLLEGGTRSHALRQSAYRLIAGNIGRRCSTGDYYDPIQQICVRLPLGYDHAWASDSGEYLLSSRSDVYPESGFTEIWKIMEPLGLEPSSPEPPAASAT